jgi:hypothetical protein
MESLPEVRSPVILQLPRPIPLPRPPQVIHQTQEIQRRVTRPEDVLEFWPFFQEGLTEFNKLAMGPWRELTNGEWLSYLLNSAADPETYVVGVILSKHGKPLCFGLSEVRDNFYGEKTLTVVFTYSNDKSFTAVASLLALAEKICKEMGIHKIMAQSRRATGASIRWFEKKLRFKRLSIQFYKEV